MLFVDGRDAIVDCVFTPYVWKLIIYSLVPTSLLLLCLPSYYCHNTSDHFFTLFLYIRSFLTELNWSDSSLNQFGIENYCSTRLLTINIWDKECFLNYCYQKYYCSCSAKDIGLLKVILLSQNNLCLVSFCLSVLTSLLSNKFYRWMFSLNDAAVERKNNLRVEQHSWRCGLLQWNAWQILSGTGDGMCLHLITGKKN